MQGMIDIKISKSETAQGQAPDVQQTSREPGKQSTKNQAVGVALIAVGKQVAIQGVNQFASLSGNYAQAERFNAILSIGSDIAIAATGPVGLIAIGAKTAINMGNSFIKQTIARRSIDLQRDRAGFVSTQGSRYGR